MNKSDLVRNLVNNAIPMKSEFFNLLSEIVAESEGMTDHSPNIWSREKDWPISGSARAMLKGWVSFFKRYCQKVYSDEIITPFFRRFGQELKKRGSFLPGWLSVMTPKSDDYMNFFIVNLTTELDQCSNTDDLAMSLAECLRDPRLLYDN